jgi:hypothetical protein
MLHAMKSVFRGTTAYAKLALGKENLQRLPGGQLRKVPVG